MAPDVWAAKRIEMLVDLMHRIAQFLGYDFNTVEITKEVYLPKAHGQIETDQEIIRRGFARLFARDAVLPVTLLPTDTEAREHILKWLKGESAVHVKVNG